MDIYFQYVGFLVIYLSAAAGILITTGFLINLTLNKLGKQFKSLWNIVEFVYHKKEFKEWVKGKERLSKNTEEQEKSRRIKSSFEVYFDGGYEIEPQPNTSNTYAMGVCKLEFDVETDTLTVHLRRPGLLIGRAGIVIDGLKEYLDCNIVIKEVRKF